MLECFPVVLALAGGAFTLPRMRGPVPKLGR
jgi:hypothetical protein